MIGFYLPSGVVRTLSDVPAEAEVTLNAWLQIDPQGQVTIWVGRSEMGQGPRTSVAMIMADELGADWSKVRVRQADLDAKYGDQVTGGSFSTRFAWGNLRKPAAAAREMLIAVAAAELNAPASEFLAEAGAVIHRPSARRLGFGELAERAAKVPVPADPPLKDPKDYRIIGTRRGRVDTPLIVAGRAVYGLDARVPGMLYAVIERSPVFGGKVKRFDAARAKAVPGVRHVVEIPRMEMPIPFELKPGAPGHQHYTSTGVAVVADSTWAAIEGRRALEVQWDEGPAAGESTANLRQQFVDLLAQPGQVLRNDGDVTVALRQAARVVEAEYEVPFLAHAPMEPPNCTALVRDGRCELWVPTQNAPAVRAALVTALVLPESAITVHVTLLGGGFGRRLNMDYAVEAALVSRAVGAPVKVVWTREDDLRHGYYRPASLHRLRAGLDASGRVVGWHHHIAAPSTDSFYSGQNSPDADGVQIAGSGATAGTVPNYRCEFSYAKTAVPRGWWRAVDLTSNVFVVQSFMDELAAAAGRDPMALRRELIGPPQTTPPTDPERVNIWRLRNVFELAAQKGGWGQKVPAGRGRGIAGAFGFGSYVAQVAEVSVNRDAGVRVHRVVCVVDCGQVINPDMVAAQMEGGIVFGLSAALKGAITVQNGRVQQSNFHEYQMLRIGEMPKVEVHIVPSRDYPGGVGEPGVPPIAPAVTNAIFAATGKRIRRLPIRAEDLG